MHAEPLIPLIKKHNSPRWIDTTWRGASCPDLLVDVTASGYIKGAPDAHAGSVQGPGSRFGHMTATVNLLVVDRVLIVVIRLQGEFGAADRALEAARVEEREVLQGTHPVHLVDGLSASQTRALVEVGPIHDACPALGDHSVRALPALCVRLVVLITAHYDLVRRSVSFSMRATLGIKGLDQGIEKLPLTTEINTR